MSNPWLQLGAAFAALVILCFAVLEGENVGEALGLIAPDEQVLVFTIPNAEAYDRVKGVVDPARILVDVEHGVALEGHRVYVRRLDQAGVIIKAAGWVEQPIQIIGLGMVDERDVESRDGGHPMSDEERLARLRELVHKPTLTRGEQLFVLHAMNDGLQI